MSDQRFKEVLQQIIGKHDKALAWLEAERKQVLEIPENTGVGTVTRNDLLMFVDQHVARHQQERRVAEAALSSFEE